jgi:hypothetical protein
VPIDREALASSIAGLAELSAAGRGLEQALEHVVTEVDRMEREGLDQRGAFELLRQRARASRVRVIDLARRVVAGEPLEPASQP